MIFNVWFVIVGALFIVMALSSTLLRHLPVTTSLLYLAVGITLGPLGFSLIRFNPLEHSAVLERLTEVAVVISLFTAGLKMRVPLRDFRWRPAFRLASLTMLATVALITMLGVTLLELPLGAAVLLGAVLAPTDPVLASDVQVDDAADRDQLRFSLTGEAGMNDGTAFPFVMLGLGLLGTHEIGVGGWRWFTVDLVWAVVAGLLIGWFLGVAVGRLTVYLRREREQAVGYEDFLALGLVALSYGTALLCFSYGFLAVFAAGLGLRHVEMREVGVNREPGEVLESVDESAEEKLATHEEAAPVYMVHSVLGFSEQAERILEFTVVLVLGGIMTYASFSAASVLFVAMMLLIVRPTAVFATLYGQGTSRHLRRYSAWLGIRGIGSLYYLFYSFQHGVEGSLARELLGVTLAVVATSIVVHGISVTPIMLRYRKLRRHPAPS